MDRQHVHSKPLHEQVLDKSQVAHDKSQVFHDKSQDIHEQVIENQIAGEVYDKRFCKVSFEDEVAQRGIKYVGTADG